MQQDAPCYSSGPRWVRMVGSCPYEYRGTHGIRHETGRLGIASKACVLGSKDYYLVAWSQAVPLLLLL